MKNEDEILDLVDENDKLIGTVKKSVAHGDPSKIHREVDIIVFTKAGEVLIQQRSKNKSDAGKWESSCTGHVQAGEDPAKGMARELHEELGIKVTPVYYKKVFVKSKKQARFFWCYYSIVDKKLPLELDEVEVSDAKWIPVTELEEFAKNNWWDLEGDSHRMIMDLYRKHFR